jgi:hypothetical protein
MSDEETAPQPRDPPAADESASAPVLASEISRRVGAILDAVEREAVRLREEARADAARYLEDARVRADALVAERRQLIAELSGELIAKSEAVVSRLDDAEPVREGFENLVRALGDAAERLALEAESEPQPPRPAPPVPSGPMATPEPMPAAGRSGDQPHPARAPSPAGFAQPRGSSWRELDDARTVAIRMAAAGSTRAEVGLHLTRALGVTDPTRTLDEVFGPGSGDRLPRTGTGG